LSPKDYDVAYTLGLTYLKQHQFSSARKIYERMIIQLGNRPQLRVLFGRAYRETGFLPEAIEEFRKAITLDTHFPRAHYHLGLTYLLKDGAAKLGEASDEFKLELAAHPDEFYANYYLGIVYVSQGKAAFAVELLEKASQIQPNNPTLTSSWARLIRSQRNTKRQSRRSRTQSPSIPISGTMTTR